MRLALVVLTLALGGGRSAAADPLRLRANALATTTSPAGLLVLEADASPAATLSAEAVVWMAGLETAPGTGGNANVLVVAVHARSQSGRIGARLGRFVATLGALRPTHVDGTAVRVQLPRRFEVETVAGVPVVAEGTRAWDWFVGGRVSRKLGDSGSVGIAYAQRRDAGRLASEELGVDAGLALDARHDVGARVAYDVATPGLAEVALSSSHRRKALRVEAYAIHRVASHLLPATSLFSVLGDAPSQRLGGLATWRAAPRLDLIGDVGVRRVDDATSPDLTARARLRLDDRGASVLGAELRRGGVDDDAWTGARGTARLALRSRFTLGAELELVRPDRDRGRGTLWPWGLVSGGWSHGDWQVALAVEASASPEFRGRVDVLAQLVRRWGLR